MGAYQFQVDLRSIIDLLSSHLYSGPEVFVRELLQNGVDAVRARQALEPGHAGKIDLELMRGEDDGAILLVEDNGIGLTAEEVHQFLATIGGSSKREDLLNRRADFIGQFGIGLLSCFIVTDEIVLVSQSAKADTRPVEWRGRSDGSYTLRELERSAVPGTKVYLKANKAGAAFFKFEALARQVRHFGSLLRFPISLTENGQRREVNVTPPWRETHVNEQGKNAAYLSYGAQVFEHEFFDYIPLADETLGFEGAAYILPFSPSPTARKAHRVYLKDMLVSDHADNLLPEWAFFAKCVINTRSLRPTASRESVYEDEKLEALRNALGEALRNYVVRLATYDQVRLRRFLLVHFRAIKHLAASDDESLLLFIDHLPFTTTFGELTLAECRARADELFYIADVDEFRQVAEIAAAQRLCVLNAGYVFDAEILERLGDLKPEQRLQPMRAGDIVQRLADVSLGQRDAFFDFLGAADRILQRFRVRADLRTFQPDTLPALYVASRDALFQRRLEQTKETTTGLWSGILSGFSGDAYAEEVPELCFNASNPLVQQLGRSANEAHGGSRVQLQKIVKVLYVQALLFSRRGLSQAELQALNDGILHLARTALQSGAEPASDAL